MQGPPMLPPRQCLPVPNFSLCAVAYQEKNGEHQMTLHRMPMCPKGLSSATRTEGTEEATMPPTTRERLRDAIHNIRPKSPDSEEAIIALALKLSSEYQQSGLTLDQIIDEVKAAISGKPGPRVPPEP